MHDLFCKFHSALVAEPVIRGSLVSMEVAHAHIYIYKYMCNNCNVAQPKNQPNTQPGPIERHRRLGSRRTSESFRADDQVGIRFFLLVFKSFKLNLKHQSHVTRSMIQMGLVTSKKSFW